ncbi:glycine rich protein, putative [Trichomonas vaginalis G3]|uniref:receptor protein-tyrosine kinase n=1 Tax=Trichomonas vaginalis (strain ATCC PRA-98 / G3) TaxID=412133 RepID=A2G011_TRIV3|nr:glycine-rich protein family [Trichomonas vaginalis G3]EAX89511.1 glycine rich protein, putative [Trichomonas vaginalis G3]KAI5505512.1 glycine-rich protein family [Trichomonas vaginalis G3]|eukprot:XP_001302441.1 glycine rich protein [Trichomonas vaginalis G3]
MIKGGYGGGGATFNHYGADYNYGSGSGGGQTAVKFLSNDLWHRVIVSGAGGGSDNVYPTETLKGTDDGSGGAGGGFVGQGYWQNGQIQLSRLADSTSGFTFGSGESAQFYRSRNPKGVQSSYGGADRPGAGAGWFGGFAGHHQDAGAGGGSSWALSENRPIPTGTITAHGSFYNESESHPYAFTLNDGFIFKDVKTASGVWEGHGRLVITIIQRGYSICRINYNLRFSNEFLLCFSVKP